MPRQKTDKQLEAEYQASLIKKLQRLFPGCEIEKWSDLRQGYPDLIILWMGMWAVLEVKAYEGAPEQPNQRHYIEKFARQTFAAFIYPENEVEVLRGLQQSFESSRNACIPKS